MNPCVISWSSFSDDFLVDRDSVFRDSVRVNSGCVRWRIHTSAIEAVSVTTEAATTQFPWLFLSQQRMWALTNPNISYGSCFVDDFWIGVDWYCLGYFWVNRGCVHWQIHVSTMEAVLLMISKSASTQISLTISKSTGAVCADESMCRLLKLFLWWILRRQGLSFPWIFLSKHGLCALMNPRVIYEAVLLMIFELASTEFSLTIWKSTVVVYTDESIHQLWKQFQWRNLRQRRLKFRRILLSQQRFRAPTNPCVIPWSSFSDDFSVVINSVFHEYFLVNRGCVRQGIHVSALETVSVTIYESAGTQISSTIFESTGAMCAYESMHQLWKQFRWSFLSRQRHSFPWLFKSQEGLRSLTNPCMSFGSYFGDDFLVGDDLVFLEYFWANRGCVHWRIQASALQAVSVMISSASTLFSLTIYESTGAVCADESMRRLLKLFLWWILSWQGLNFPWTCPSKQGLLSLTNPRVISASSFVDDFWIGIDWVFLDYLKVHSGCVRWRIYTSVMEAVLVT